MRKLGTAPSYPWFCAWLMDQGERTEDWRYINNIRYLYEYRDIELHVVVGYPSGFARPGDWEEAQLQMAARNITEKREV